MTLSVNNFAHFSLLHSVKFTQQEYRLKAVNAKWNMKYLDVSHYLRTGLSYS